MQRRISWVKGALKDFEAFPDVVRDRVMFALRMAAGGEKADTAKPLKGLGTSIFEIALRHRGDVFRAVYSVQIGEDIWVLHAFRKKSKSGIETPKPYIDLVRERIKRLEEHLR